MPTAAKKPVRTRKTTAPTARKAAARPSGRGKATTPPSEPAATPPEPPKRRGRPRKGPLDPTANLDKQSKELWKRTIEQLTAQGTWADSDVPLLERYIRSTEVGRLARDRIAERAKRNPDSAYTTRGSQGQLVQHPDLKTAREAEKDANDYAQDLLLSSRSRKQHDIRPKEPAGGRLAAILSGTAGAGAQARSPKRGK